jgi:hypothetical protein
MENKGQHNNEILIASDVYNVPLNVQLMRSMMLGVFCHKNDL